MAETNIFANLHEEEADPGSFGVVRGRSGSFGVFFKDDLASTRDTTFVDPG